MLAREVGLKHEGYIKGIGENNQAKEGHREHERASEEQRERKKPGQGVSLRPARDVIRAR